MCMKTWCTCSILDLNSFFNNALMTYYTSKVLNKIKRLFFFFYCLMRVSTHSYYVVIYKIANYLKLEYILSNRSNIRLVHVLNCTNILSKLITMRSREPELEPESAVRGPHFITQMSNFSGVYLIRGKRRTLIRQPWRYSRQTRETT